MSEYTPTTSDIGGAWLVHQTREGHSPSQAVYEFERWKNIFEQSIRQKVADEIRDNP